MAARSEAPELSARVDDAQGDLEEADEVGAVVALDEPEGECPICCVSVAVDH
jgi:hypothetical protein